MSLLGVHLTTCIGPTVAVPIDATLAETIDQVQVTHGDDQPSGVQITFRVGKSQTTSLSNDLLLQTMRSDAFVIGAVRSKPASPAVTAATLGSGSARRMALSG